MRGRRCCGVPGRRRCRSAAGSALHARARGGRRGAPPGRTTRGLGRAPGCAVLVGKEQAEVGVDALQVLAQDPCTGLGVVRLDRAIELQVVPVPEYDGFEEEIRYFAECVGLNRRPEKCPPKDSAAAVKVALSMLGARVNIQSPITSTKG